MQNRQRFSGPEFPAGVEVEGEVDSPFDQPGGEIVELVECFRIQRGGIRTGRVAQPVVMVVEPHGVVSLRGEEVDEPVLNDEGETVGVDVNVVNNFITASDGHVMDYDREYLTQMFRMVSKVDKLGYGNLSKGQLRRYRKIIRRNEWYFRRLIHDFLMYCQSKGIVNVVMEDLRSFDGTYIRDRETGIKYSRIVRLLRLSNVKNWLLTQAEKLGIRVHLTPSHYTSQQCPECGHIDRENRKTQEEFRCVNCGHEVNADYNASVNIKNRFTVNVLRYSRLHTFDDYGRMRPLTHNKYVVRRVLEESAACT